MERDLLPWILSGALITTGAIAAAIEFGGDSPSVTPAASSALGGARAASSIAAGSLGAAPASISATATATPDRGPARVPTAAGISTLAANSTATANSTPAATPEPGATPTPAAAGASSELPGGEVWQCIVNGQKIFSDKRCGSDASVRQIGDLNVMDVPAAPPASYGYYQPGYGSAPYAPAPDYPDQDDDTGNAPADLYAGQRYILAKERARREHWSRPHHHVRPPQTGRVSESRNPR